MINKIFFTTLFGIMFISMGTFVGANVGRIYAVDPPKNCRPFPLFFVYIHEDDPSAYFYGVVGGCFGGILAILISLTIPINVAKEANILTIVSSPILFGLGIFGAFLIISVILLLWAVRNNQQKRKIKML